LLSAYFSLGQSTNWKKLYRNAAFTRYSWLGGESALAFGVIAAINKAKDKTIKL
jgi:hypothetical protein